MSLANRVVVVTGGAQGLGREVAFEAATRGARVAILDLQQDKGASVRDEILSRGGQALFSTCDVASRSSCEESVRHVVDTFGALDGIVNNASIFATIHMKPFWEIAESDWDRLMAVNLKGVWQLTTSALNALRASAAASVVNIASATVFIGRANYAHYVASKAGVLGLTRAMARELGAFNIRVNGVAPGMILTEVPRETVTPVQQAVTIAAQCLRRAGEPRDIARVVAFLLGEDSEFMSGQTLCVDGGATMP